MARGADRKSAQNSHVEPPTEDCLARWQKANVDALMSADLSAPGRQDVTFVAYWFWNDERFHRLQYAIRVPILMTRRYCGNIPGVLWVNREDAALSEFCQSLNVDLRVDRGLTGGVRQLNTDYIENLHRRFETEHVLTIQDDGFPIRTGLDEFVGRYDYIAAPWDLSGDDWITRRILRHRNAVGNGGFSLRSRAICERAAYYFKRKYKLMPYCYLRLDDFFYCRLLPTYEPKYRRQTSFAPVAEAARFSVERHWQAFEEAGGDVFGFHSIPAFEYLLGAGKVAVEAGDKAVI